MRLVLIEWVDSFGCSSVWQTLSDECSPHSIVCQSFGWLFRDGRECNVIIPHVADIGDGQTKQGCGDMAIPTNCIRQMHDHSIPISN